MERNLFCKNYLKLNRSLKSLFILCGQSDSFGKNHGGYRLVVRNDVMSGNIFYLNIH